jgi:NAD(P)-dependent dehydrogenase (short-subunit alcohol dehydrogenase family)
MHYGAAKAALEALTVGLSRAGAPSHILVNSIQAGFIQTPFHAKMGRQSVKRRIGMIPLKRPGNPMDIARMAYYLASGAGDFITGQTLVISGGD